jgi:hypothetical protein
MTTMALIVVTQPFRFAHSGHQVQEFFPAAEPVDATDDCAELAIAEGWATAADQPPASPPPQKARPAAPANKDAAPKRSTKATPA